MMLRGRLDLGCRSRSRSEDAEQRHHDDRVHVDVAEVARSQVPRHAPAAPVEQWRGLGAEGRVLERGVDPHAQHRGLVDVRGVVPAQQLRSDVRPDVAASGPKRSGISASGVATACTARTVRMRASSPLLRKYR